MRVLARMWQMLLKALEEVAQAPNAMMAAEMAVIRLTHVADLPTPEEVLRKLQDSPPAPNGGGGMTAGSAGTGGHTARSPAPMGAAAARGPAMQSSVQGGGAATALARAPGVALSDFPDFEAVMAFVRERRDMPLLIDVESHLRLARYSPGRIEFEPGPDAPPDLAARLRQRLRDWTALDWGVSVVSGGGAPSIAETRATDRKSAEAGALRNPLVAAVLSAFPGAKIAGVRNLEALAAAAEAAAATEALPEVDEEWDPFEDG
jgi:DNA polymerase-3 subunit gamma/tau